MPKLSLLQLSATDDKDKNIERAAEMCRKAADEGGQIICLPEAFATTFRVMELDYSFFEVAETIPGPTTDVMSKLAASLGAVIVVPLFERVERGVFYNSAAVIDSSGELLGTYRKQHIPLSTLFYEKLYFKPGNLGYPVFDTEFGKIGVYICHDRHYPEGARALALNGADLVVIPVATPTASLSRPVFELEVQAHAVFNEMFVAAVNRVGTEGEYTYYGASLISGPDGVIRIQGGDGEEIVSADLDYREIDERRLKWQFYRERRPHTYGILTQELP